MNRYHFQHHDGRTGHGCGTWQAMRDALGVDEASALSDVLDEIRDRDWQFIDDLEHDGCYRRAPMFRKDADGDREPIPCGYMLVSR